MNNSILYNFKRSWYKKTNKRHFLMGPPGFGINLSSGIPRVSDQDPVVLPGSGFQISLGPDPDPRQKKCRKCFKIFFRRKLKNYD